MKIAVDSRREFLSKLVDLISLAPQIQPLRKKEKEFFIENVILAEEGVDLASKQAVAILTERLGFNRESDVYRYRGLIRDKDWLKQTEYGYDLPLRDVPNRVSFDLHIVYDDELGGKEENLEDVVTQKNTES